MLIGGKVDIADKESAKLPYLADGHNFKICRKCNISYVFYVHILI